MKHKTHLILYMIPKSIVFMLSCFHAFMPLCAGQNYEWAKNIGSGVTDIGNDIITDASGNVYLTGSFGDTADFNPGPDTANLTSAGGGDIFIAKYDVAGNYLWAIGIGGISGDDGKSVSSDDYGNVYVTGYFQDSVDFDPSQANTAYLTATGFDIFIAKYDSSGNYLWAVNIGGAFNDQGKLIALDASGNVYVTGFFLDTADFDPDISTANLVSAGGDDIFIAKYDSAGNFLWAVNIGGSFNDQGKSIALDASGNVYVTGSFQDTADFDPDISTVNLVSAGGDDIFIAKYDSAGNFLWAKNMGGNGFDAGNALFIDSMLNVYVTGYFQDTADFDPGVDTANLISSGANDIFIAKYDSSGNFLRAKNTGGIGNDIGKDIFMDASGNVYVTGSFQGTADFDPSQTDTVNLVSDGFSDIFIAKYDSSGNYLWAINLGGGTNDIGNGLTVDNLYNVYITGFFQGTADFDPGADTLNLISVGQDDIFFLKYSQCLTPVIILLTDSILVECEGDSVSFIVSAAGGPVPLYYQWQKDGAGIADATDTIFTIPSLTSDTSGVYICVVTNVCGADTGTPVTLLVNPTNYPSPPDSVCKGDSLLLPGGLWVDSTGIYYDTLTSLVTGCDSVIITDLTLIPLPTAGITGTTAVCSGDTTVITATGGLYFIWNTGDTISTGDTSSSIPVSPLTDTTYFVTVSNPGCGLSDSASITITVKPLPEIIAVAACSVPCGDTASILLGEDVTLSVSGGVSYNWTPPGDFINPNTSAPVATPAKSTLYYAYGTDSNGCTNVDSVLIIVSEDFKIEVPDIFSPNGDGHNDILYVSANAVSWITFSIFDRWGELVFKSDNIDVGWDGIYNNMPMNPATFIYYLKADFPNGKTITKQGSIALVR